MPDCMAALNRSGLAEAIRDTLKNKPFFGICVGAQLLFEHSEEGDTQGLGWFSGCVKRFEAWQTDAQGNCLKIPHMGWNNVHQTQAHPLFAHIPQDERFYFVHSYYFAPAQPEITLQPIPTRICLHHRQRQRVRHPIPHRKKPRSRAATVAKFPTLATLNP